MDNEVMLYFITENVIVDNSISFELQSSDRITTTEQKTFFFGKTYFSGIKISQTNETFGMRMNYYREWNHISGFYRLENTQNDIALQQRLIDREVIFPSTLHHAWWTQIKWWSTTNNRKICVWCEFRKWKCPNTKTNSIYCFIDMCGRVDLCFHR